MNSSITTLYVLIENNRVVSFGNMKDIVEDLQNIEPTARIYQYYYRLFKKSPEFKQEIGGKVYFFQKLI